MSRLSLRVVGSIMGNCLIITDNETEKNVEVMALQLKGILGSEQSTGELPHAGWTKEGEQITIYHDDERDKHEVTFTLQELGELIK
ncbi:hypothetical protein [Bacillus thuringiensis]|uniref:hypothetical protein n=1 Tax=Bacillus thuringiensis TaxID=1428 RepID=UPI002DBB353F|nr:hypothetical protein [Bacillus thuringiensis]MEC3455332.1 hypothetical protein [Bacillus thuringiensis]